MRFASAFLAASLAAPLAFAQPPPPPPPDPTMEPGATGATSPSPGTILPNMLPSRYGATLDARLDYSAFDDGGDDDLFLMGLVLHGQFLSTQNYGAYITLPYVYASSDGDSEQGVANIELGGLYKLPQGAASEILLRGGIAIDTAGSTEAFLAPVSQLGPRLYDAYVTGLSTNWLRLEGSFRHSEGNLRFGISGGADIPFAGDDGEGLDTIDLDALVKGAVSVGFESPTGGVGVGIGLSALYAVGTENEDSSDNLVLGLNATVSFPVTPAVSVYGAFGLPDLEDNADDFDVFGIGVGVRAAIN